MNPNIAISNIMTTAPIAVKKETSFLDIQKIFDQYSFHHLPVVGHDLQVEGIISRTDLLAFSKNLLQETSGKTFTELTEVVTLARDIMTPQPYVLDPDDTIGLAADIFLANTFHALPIVEDKKIVGIITSHDLLKYAFNKAIAEEE